MDIKTLEQALKLQNDLATRLTQSLTSGIAGKAPSLDVLVKEKEKSLALAQTEVEAATKERDLAVARWDERVTLCKTNVVKLQTELDDLRKQLKERPDPTTGNIRKEPRGKKGK